MTSNVAASVRARLANEAKRTRRPFQEMLQHFALERFLYRLSLSPYRGRFVLKGALLLRVWNTPTSRPTRDIDLLGYVENELGTLERIVRELCAINAAEDGLRFDADTVAAQRIKEDADYQGLRVTFRAFLERAQIPMQLDIGFGDVIHPSAQEGSYPTVLEFPPAELRMYPRETVVAEKFEAMVQLGRLNSRMKDFFDLWLLSRSFDFGGAELSQALAKTFANRGTALEVQPIALTAAHTKAEATQQQWAAFVRRSALDSAPRTLEEIREPLLGFLRPVATALVNGHSFTDAWVAPGPWRGVTT